MRDEFEKQKAIIEWYEGKCEPVLKSWFNNDKDAYFPSGYIFFDQYFMEWVKDSIEGGSYDRAILTITMLMDYMEEYIKPVAQDYAERKLAFNHEIKKWENIKALMHEWHLLNQ